MSLCRYHFGVRRHVYTKEPLYLRRCWIFLGENETRIPTAVLPTAGSQSRARPVSVWYASHSRITGGDQLWSVLRPRAHTHTHTHTHSTLTAPCQCAPETALCHPGLPNHKRTWARGDVIWSVDWFLGHLTMFFNCFVYLASWCWSTLRNVSKPADFSHPEIFALLTIKSFRHHLEDRGVDVMMVLEWILRRLAGGCGVDSLGWG
jgi:hypothetical protein